MKTFDFRPDTNLLSIQQYANSKGWKIVKASWLRGVRVKQPKWEVPDDRTAPTVKEQPPFWRLFYLEA